MIPLKFGYSPLDLSHFASFDEKFQAVISHLEIHAVFCQLALGEIPDKSYDDTYHVNEILVPGGQPSYIKTLMIDVLKLFQDSLWNYVFNSDDYFTIRKTLENSIDKCKLLAKKMIFTEACHTAKRR